MLSPSNFGSKVLKPGQAKKSLQAEETKVNFFDPNSEGLNQTEMRGMLYDITDKPEEQKILETRIDPLEWKQEIDRVYRDLSNLEKDIEILVK